MRSDAPSNSRAMVKMHVVARRMSRCQFGPTVSRMSRYQFAPVVSRIRALLAMLRALLVRLPAQLVTRRVSVASDVGGGLSVLTTSLSLSRPRRAISLAWLACGRNKSYAEEELLAMLKEDIKLLSYVIDQLEAEREAKLRACL